MQVESDTKKAESDVVRKEQLNKIDVDFKSKMSQLSIERNTELTKIEAEKFKAIVECLGTETLLSIARVRPIFKLLERNGEPGQAT